MQSQVHTYQWQGIRKQATCHGISLGESKKEVSLHLRQQGILPLKLTSTKSYYAKFTRAKPKSELKYEFTETMASLLKANIPLLQALDIAAKQQTKDKLFQAQVFYIRRLVQTGAPLHLSLARFDACFDPLYCQLIRLGEQTGALAESFEFLSSHLKKLLEINKQIKKAMLYPTLVLVMSYALFLFTFLFVLPKFALIFSQFNAKLPSFSENLFMLNQVFLDHLGLFFAIQAGLFAVGVIYFKPHAFEIAAKIPILKQYVLELELYLSIQTLASACSAELELTKSLLLCQRTSRLDKLSLAYQNLYISIRQGISLSDAMRNEKIYPDFVIEGIKIGETSGTLSAQCQRVATNLQQDLDKKITPVLSFIEPIFLLFIGTMIAFVLLALYLPILDLIQSV